MDDHGTPHQQPGDREDLVAGIGHDLRGTRQTLGLALRHLRTSDDATERQQLFEQADAAYRELSVLTNLLVEAAVLGTGRTAAHDQPAELVDVVADLNSRYAARASNEGVRFGTRLQAAQFGARSRTLLRMIEMVVSEALDGGAVRRISVLSRRTNGRCALRVVAWAKPSAATAPLLPAFVVTSVRRYCELLAITLEACENTGRAFSVTVTDGITAR